MMHEGRESLLLADGYGYRVVDTETGAVTTTFDLTDFGFADASSDAAVNNEFFALTYAVNRPRVFLVDRKSRKTVNSWAGFKVPYGIVLRSNGDPIVADFAAGALIGLSRTDKKSRDIVAGELDGPVGLAWADSDALYVTEALSGTLARLGLSDASKTIIATNLNLPEGLTVLADGRIAVVEVGKQRLIAVDPATGKIDILADNLPVGRTRANAPAPVYVPSSVAEGADGSLYLSGDNDHSVLKLVRQP